MNRFEFPHARAALLTSVSALALFAMPALGATVTVNAPVNTGVSLDATDNALINNSAISNTGNNNNAGVFSSDPVLSILNNAGASIVATGANAPGVYIDNTIGSFTNYGTISTERFSAVGASGFITTFLNAGTITSTDPAGNNGVGAQAGFGTFTNTSGGTITGSRNGVTTDGNTTSFNNAGTIIGQAGTGVGFFSGAGVGTFTNSGTIRGLDGGGVEVDGLVSSFANLAGGTISGDNSGNDAAGVNFNGAVTSFSNAGAITGEGNAVNFNANVGSFANSGTLTGGQFNAVRFAQDVTTFANTGTITAQPNSAGVGVDGNAGTIFNSGVISGGDAGFNLSNAATSFTNSGTVSGIFHAFRSGLGVGTFNNSGSLSATSGTSVEINGPVTSFTNSGSISAANDRGVDISGNVSSFTNTGTITSSANGVSFGGNVADFNNSGSIIATAASGQFGVRVDGLGILTNSGLIQGAEGIHFNGNNANVFTNSGTIRGTDGDAIVFNSGNELLKILTGSQIYGNVQFGGGSDTFDFSAYYGTTVLSVPGLETVVAGDRLYAFVAPNTIAIYDPTGASSIDDIQVPVAGAIRNILDNAIADPASALDGETLINGYVAQPKSTAATDATTAVLSNLDIADPTGATAWASTFGGFSQDKSPVDLSNTYGGIVAGTHAALGSGTTIGGLAAYSRGSFVVANGAQTIASDTGILGVYGETDLGVVTIDYSLLGGASAHSSSRQVVALGVLQTARANFSSWFLSPEIGVELPLLASAEGELNVKASASYLGGGVSAYTETTPGGSVSVGAMGIGVWQGEIELNGSRIISSNEHGDVVLEGKVGLLAQANAGTSNIPVNILGTTVAYSAPGTSSYGAFVGASITAPLTDIVTLSAGVDGSVRTDGTTAASANVGLSADF